MKKFASCILISALALTCLTSCSSRKADLDSSKETSETLATAPTHLMTSDEIDQIDEEVLPTEICPDFTPDLYQVQSICELAVMECYYNNVAVGVISPGTGISHWGEEEKPFWVEYSATITYGIDYSEVTMEITDDTIIVTMPHAQVLGDVVVDSNSIGDPIYKPNEWWQNDVTIHASYINEAIAAANSDLLGKANEDDVVLRSAEYRARTLIENYINQLMFYSNVDYEIEFVYTD